MINAQGRYDERVPPQYGRGEHRQSWTYIKNGMGAIVNTLTGTAGAMMGSKRVVERILDATRES